MDPFVEFVVSSIRISAEWTRAKAERFPDGSPQRAALVAATFKLGEAAGHIVKAMDAEGFEDPSKPERVGEG